MSSCQVLPPVSRAFTFSVPWKPSPNTVSPEHFTHINSAICGMGLVGALWQEAEPAAEAPRRHVWERRRTVSHESAQATSSSDVGYASGSVPAARGSVPVPAPTAAASGSVLPPAAVSVPVLPTKRGRLIIRSAALHQNINNCDVFVNLVAQTTTLFNETMDDGRSEAVQEQVLDHRLRTLLHNVKNVIRRQLSEKRGSGVRVVIQSHRGKHRSVAMAEVLGQECAAFAEVQVWHMAVGRWDASYPVPPVDMEPAPKNGLVFQPDTRNAN